MGRKALIQSHSLEHIHQRSACFPNMRGEQTPEPMVTGRNSTKEAVRSCEQKLWKLYGKKSLMNGLRDQKLGFPSGLVFDLVKKLEIQTLLKVEMKKQRLLLMKNSKKKKRRRRKKKKKRRNKSLPDQDG